MNDPILYAPHFDQIFEVQADTEAIVKVRGFEPELRGREIVLPVEVTKRTA